MGPWAGLDAVTRKKFLELLGIESRSPILWTGHFTDLTFPVV